jgi:Xaa-Pro dipeptidase
VSASAETRFERPHGARYFALSEYEDRWARVNEEIRRQGYEAAVVWSRSGGSYDRCADVLWLANYYSQASGQGLDTAVFNARALGAVILQPGTEAELQADEPWPRRDVVAAGTVEWHYDPIKGVADALRKRGIRGRVAIVGTQILPMKHWLQLERETAADGIEWVHDDDLVLNVRRKKSVAEIQCMREGGEIMTTALNRLMQGLIDGEPESVAAGATAEIIVREGGAVHMIPCSHGEMIRYWVSDPLYGHSHAAPQRGDLVRGWIYGPVREGYWLDPGRTAVCGGNPTADQRSLVEDNARIIETLIEAVRPGARLKDVALLGQKLVTEASDEKDQAAEKWPHFGHYMGMFFETPYIGATMCSEDDTFEAGTVLGVEAFISRKDVGASGIEQNFILHEDGTTEAITRSPYLWW